MYRPTAGWTNGWTMFLSDTDTVLTDFAIFTKALRTDRGTNGPTDGPTEGPTDGPTDGHTLLYRCDSRI